MSDHKDAVLLCENCTHFSVEQTHFSSNSLLMTEGFRTFSWWTHDFNTDCKLDSLEHTSRNGFDAAAALLGGRTHRHWLACVAFSNQGNTGESCSSHPPDAGAMGSEYRAAQLGSPRRTYGGISPWGCCDITTKRKRPIPRGSKQQLRQLMGRRQRR